MDEEANSEGSSTLETEDKISSEAVLSNDDSVDPEKTNIMKESYPVANWVDSEGMNLPSTSVVEVEEGKKSLESPAAEAQSTELAESLALMVEENGMEPLESAISEVEPTEPLESAVSEVEPTEPLESAVSEVEPTEPLDSQVTEVEGEVKEILAPAAAEEEIMVDEVATEGIDSPSILTSVSETGEDSNLESQTSESTSSNIIVSDDFSRGTADTLGYTDTGQTWEELSGNWAIANNQAYETTGTGVNLAVVESGNSDGEVSAVFANSAGNPRLVFRAQDVDNYWYVAWHAPSQTLQLYKRMGGSNQYVGGWHTTQPGKETKVVLNGNEIQAYADGAMFLKLNDTFNQKATKHGLGNTASSETKINDFKPE